MLRGRAYVLRPLVAAGDIAPWAGGGDELLEEDLGVDGGSRGWDALVVVFNVPDNQEMKCTGILKLKTKRKAFPILKRGTPPPQRELTAPPSRLLRGIHWPSSKELRRGRGV